MILEVFKMRYLDTEVSLFSRWKRRDRSLY